MRKNYRMVDVRRKIQRASLEQQTRWWTEDCPDWTDSYGTFRREIARALLRHPEGVRFLKAQAQSGESERRYQALMDLADQKIVDDEIVRILVAAFDEDEPRLRYGALIGLREAGRFPLDRNMIIELVERHTSLTDREIGAQAMMYLVYAYPEEAEDMLRAGLWSLNPLIRMNACREVMQRRIFSLQCELERLTQDEDECVRNIADTARDMLAIYKSST